MKRKLILNEISNKGELFQKEISIDLKQSAEEIKMVLQRAHRQLDEAIKKYDIGKFKVIGVDTFSHEDGEIGLYDTKEEAIEIANENSGTMYKTHVYGPNGKHIHEAGSF